MTTCGSLDPGVMDFVDLSEAALGSTTQPTVPTGVLVDGAAETVPAGSRPGSPVHGPGGHVLIARRSPRRLTPHRHVRSTGPATPPETQCGDDSFYGASGTAVVSGIPNTDPASPPFKLVQSRPHGEFVRPWPIHPDPGRAQSGRTTCQGSLRHATPLP